MFGASALSSLFASYAAPAAAEHPREGKAERLPYARNISGPRHASRSRTRTRTRQNYLRSEQPTNNNVGWSKTAPKDHPLSSHNLSKKGYHTFMCLNIPLHVKKRYTLIRELGIGAYGCVALAYDEQSERQVAIKKVSNFFDQEVLTRRTLREVASLSHLMGCPNVVQILDFDVSFIELNEVYFIFKACDADLSQIIRSDQELTESHIRFFMVQLLRGVHSMHSAHIIHRDLKPGNLLVNTDCRLFICDFGMSRAFESQNSDYLRQHLSLGDNDTNGSIVSTPDDSSQDHFAMNIIDVEADRRDTPHTDKSDQAAFMRFFYSGGADAGSEEKPLPLSKPSQIHFPGAPLTNYVATRWYRAPEVMLRNKGGYTPAMDMWSVGCILAELLGRRPIFPGSDYMDQLSRINKVLGGPSESLLDQMGSAHARHHIESLPHCEGVQWSKLYPGSPETALDLLNRLLQWDPEKRITAGEALAHPWFKRYWQGSTSTQLPSPFRRFAQVEMIHTPAEFKLAFENQSDTIKDLWMSNPSNFHLETTSSAHFPSPKRPPAVNWQHSSPQSAGTMILDSSTPSSSGPDSVHQDIMNGRLHDDEPDQCLSANEPTTSDDGVISSENFGEPSLEQTEHSGFSWLNRACSLISWH